MTREEYNKLIIERLLRGEPLQDTLSSSRWREHPMPPKFSGPGTNVKITKGPAMVFNPIFADTDTTVCIHNVTTDTSSNVRCFQCRKQPRP